MIWSNIAGSAISLIGGYFLNKKTTDSAKDASRASANAAATQAAISQDQWDSYKTIYQPMERKYVEDAQNFDSEANRERAAGEASATVSEQFGKARDRLSRTPGLDPSSAAYISAMAGLDRNQAAADAVNQNAARNRISDMAWARKTDALSLGKGLPAQASAGLAQSAMTNNAIANGLNAQANANGAAFGKVVSNVTDAWNKNGGLSSIMNTTPTRSTYNPGIQGNYDLSPINTPGVDQLGLTLPTAG